LFRIDEENLAGLKAPLTLHAFRLDVENANLTRHDDKIVVRLDIARRAETVTVENRADDFAVGKGDCRRSVPWFHQASVILIECFEFRIHQLMFIPRFRDQHQDRVGERPSVEHEKLKCVVESSRVAHDI